MSIEASQLRISLEEKERWRRTLSVTVPAPVVSKERNKLAARLAKRMKLKGFRSGKIPSGVIEQRYGEALNRETLDIHLSVRSQRWQGMGRPVTRS